MRLRRSRRTAARAWEEVFRPRVEDPKAEALEAEWKKVEAAWARHIAAAK